MWLTEQLYIKGHSTARWTKFYPILTTWTIVEILHDIFHLSRYQAWTLIESAINSVKEGRCCLNFFFYIFIKLYHHVLWWILLRHFWNSSCIFLHSAVGYNHHSQLHFYLKLVHVLLYHIFVRYFGMISQYFGMKIYYDFYQFLNCSCK